MTTTYKKLTSYLLERDDTQTTGLSGYYYGGTGEVTDNSPFNNRFNSIKLVSNTDIQEISPSGSEYFAEQSDGKIIVGSYFTTLIDGSSRSIVRIDQNGKIDQSFSNTSFNSDIVSVRLQPDGKILVGGGFTTVGGTTRNRIARLNSDGTLDSSFDPNANGSIISIALQSDGKILIGGYFTTVGGTTRNRIARLNSDGTLDSSFNPNTNDFVDTVLLKSDGKILISGGFTTVGGTTRNHIARLNSDGTLDSSFNPNVNGQILAMNLLSDGKILIGGDFTTVGGTTRDNIARLNSDGTLDSSFNTNPNSFVNHITVQPDGKILIGGDFTTVGGTTRNRIARLNSDGTLDTNFVANVISTGFFGDLFTEIESIFMTSTGKILISGIFTEALGEERNSFAIFKEVVDQAPYRLAYTVPLSTNVVVKNIFATNQNDFPVFYDIAVLPEANTSEDISEKHHYVWDDLIEENDYHEVDCNITLSAGDEIYVYSSTDENISFNIFGIEYTQ